MSDDSKTVTREELYRLVWTKPSRELANGLGISDVGLGKICKRLNVPKPPVGYWQLVAVGRSPTIPPLPRQRTGGPTIAIISPQPRLEELDLEEPAIQESIRTESLPVNRIGVPSDLRGAHPLVRNAKELLEAGHVDSYGRMHPRWNAGVKPKCLDVRVSKKTLARALRIMSALLKALEARGYEIEVNERKTRLEQYCKLVGRSCGLWHGRTSGGLKLHIVLSI